MQIGKLSAKYVAEWDSSRFDRPIIAVAAIGPAMFGFTANNVSGNPLVEIYLGWPAFEFFYFRRTWEEHEARKS